jgi:uncharacterized damage-inducible protein DinB
VEDLRVTRPFAASPVYVTGDLATILEAEQRQVEETVADLTDDQARWRPTERAKSALDILWHLAYLSHSVKPHSKDEAVAALREAHAQLQRDIAQPGKLDEMVTWWTGDRIPYRGIVWGQIRHRSYHLGELVYLRQVLDLDEPVYYHELDNFQALYGAIKG